jgi:hypothetical protein
MALMPSPVFRWLVPISDDDSGLVPAAGYKVVFYAAGTDNAKTVYTDAALTTPFSPANEVTLNDEGYETIYLGPGGYKIQILDLDDNQVFEQDNIVGDGSFGTGFAENFEALKDVDTTLNAFCYIPGYTVAGDGGHGMFYRGAAGTADGGYIQDSDYDTDFSWYRIPDENGEVRAASFGAILSSLEDDIGSLMQIADAYAASIGARLRILGVSSVTTTISTMTFSAPFVVFSPNSHLIKNAAAWTFEGIIEAEAQKLFYGSGCSAVLSDAQINARPEWWGAVRDNSTDDLIPIDACLASGPKSFLFTAGNYHVSDEPTLPANCVINSFGTVNNGDDIYIQPGVYGVGDDSLLRAYTVAADGPITAVGSVTAGAEVDAGTYLRAKAGTSSTHFKPGGIIGADLSDHTTGSGAATQLSSVTLTTGILTDVGDTIEINASGTLTDTDSANTIAIRIGTTVVCSVTLGGNGSLTEPIDWKLHALIILSEIGKVKAMAGIVSSAENTGGSTFNGFISDADSVGTGVSVTLTGDPSLNIYATPPASNTITANLFVAKFSPASA